MPAFFCGAQKSDSYVRYSCTMTYVVAKTMPRKSALVRTYCLYISICHAKNYDTQKSVGTYIVPKECPMYLRKL